MPANCPSCETSIAEPETAQELPSVVNVKGEEGATAIVSIYKCGCGHAFTTIEYKHAAAPRLSETWPIEKVQAQKAQALAWR